jgi:hypothetical protein
MPSTGSTGISLWHATRLGPAVSHGAEPPSTPERRARDRSQGILLRRRHEQRHTRADRRRSALAGFDVAAALELQLDRFPTRRAMLVLLESWLYCANPCGRSDREDSYTRSISQAIGVMATAPDPVTATAMLQRRP